MLVCILFFDVSERMNGQTGKVYGELPLSKRKVVITALIIGLIILTLGAVGGMII